MKRTGSAQGSRSGQRLFRKRFPDGSDGCSRSSCRTGIPDPHPEDDDSHSRSYPKKTITVVQFRIIQGRFDFFLATSLTTKVMVCVEIILFFCSMLNFLLHAVYIRRSGPRIVSRVSEKPVVKKRRINSDYPHDSPASSRYPPTPVVPSFHSLLSAVGKRSLPVQVSAIGG